MPRRCPKGQKTVAKEGKKLGEKGKVPFRQKELMRKENEGPALQGKNENIPEKEQGGGPQRPKKVRYGKKGNSKSSSQREPVDHPKKKVCAAKEGTVKEFERARKTKRFPGPPRGKKKATTKCETTDRKKKKEKEVICFSKGPKKKDIGKSANREKKSPGSGAQESEKNTASWDKKTKDLLRAGALRKGGRSAGRVKSAQPQKTHPHRGKKKKGGAKKNANREKGPLRKTRVFQELRRRGKKREEP